MQILKIAQTKGGRYKIQLEKDDTSRNAVPRDSFSIRFYAGQGVSGGFIGLYDKKQAKEFFCFYVNRAIIENNRKYLIKK